MTVNIHVTPAAVKITDAKTGEEIPRIGERIKSVSVDAGNLPLVTIELLPESVSLEGFEPHLLLEATEEEVCVCELAGGEYTVPGLPGVLARVEDNKLVDPKDVERCDECLRFPDDDAARVALDAFLAEANKATAAVENKEPTSAVEGPSGTVMFMEDALYELMEVDGMTPPNGYEPVRTSKGEQVECEAVYYDEEKGRWSFSTLENGERRVYCGIPKDTLQVTVSGGTRSVAVKGL